MTFLLHHLLSESAKTYPNRNAIICKSESITYRELDQISNKLANVLTETGVGKGDRVGIYMPKSIQSIVSIFGILILSLIGSYLRNLSLTKFIAIRYKQTLNASLTFNEFRD